MCYVSTTLTRVYAYIHIENVLRRLFGGYLEAADPEPHVLAAAGAREHRK